MYNLTGRQSRGFLQTVRKHLDVFKNDAEFGWSVEQQDVREFLIIRTRKFDSSNSIRSFACGLSVDATVGYNDLRVAKILAPIEGGTHTHTITHIFHYPSLFSLIHLIHLFRLPFHSVERDRIGDS